MALTDYFNRFRQSISGALGQSSGGRLQQGYFASECIETYDYNADTGLLVLRFRKAPAGPYYYYNVPPAVFKGLLSASSKGAFFNAAIRGVYE